MILQSGNTEAATKAEEVYETNKSFQGSCRLQKQDTQRTQQRCCLPKGINPKRKSREVLSMTTSKRNKFRSNHGGDKKLCPRNYIILLKEMTKIHKENIPCFYWETPHFSQIYQQLL